MTENLDDHGKKKLREDFKTLLKEPEKLEINRGVELLLRNPNRRGPSEKKTFQIKYGNVIDFFNKEIVFHFNFYVDVADSTKIKN
jgi:predicted pyridoxine 5'-phosphate oxidase superfamily flavin-nucleotide-binding protein